jgi:site-specific DNA-methyltransferase (adenine-specific)
MELNDMIGKVHCADCLEFMKQIPDKSIDLVLTDPPYGIDYNKNDRNRPNESHYENIENDNLQLNYSVLIRELQRISIKLIVFGAESFYKDLPHRGRWICWDKRLCEKADKMLGSSFELAWVDTDSGYYKTYRVLHGGVVNDDGQGERIHPTQKPINLFAKIIKDFSKEGNIILDPFVGSGTTAIACERLGRKWIGIEISDKYCEIARKRILQEQNQMKLF